MVGVQLSQDGPIKYHYAGDCQGFAAIMANILARIVAIEAKV